MSVHISKPSSDLSSAASCDCLHVVKCGLATSSVACWREGAYCVLSRVRKSELPPWNSRPLCLPSNPDITLHSSKCSRMWCCCGFFIRRVSSHATPPCQWCWSWCRAVAISQRGAANRPLQQANAVALAASG
jgi:hypothetical protein